MEHVYKRKIRRNGRYYEITIPAAVARALPSMDVLIRILNDRIEITPTPV